MHIREKEYFPTICGTRILSCVLDWNFRTFTADYIKKLPVDRMSIQGCCNYLGRLYIVLSLSLSTHCSSVFGRMIIQTTDFRTPEWYEDSEGIPHFPAAAIMRCLMQEGVNSPDPFKRNHSSKLFNDNFLYRDTCDPLLGFLSSPHPRICSNKS